MSVKKEQDLLKKYGETIKEEVNVKAVTLLGDDIEVTKSYVPIGSALSDQFGKETGQIIGAAKQGSAELLDNGNLKVTKDDKAWTLTPDQFEVRYSGIDENNQTVEGGVIVDLDLTINEELKAEGVAREISRFLNQMRKDADFTVDQRIQCFYTTENDYLKEVIQSHDNFLKQEALLTTLENKEKSGILTDTCELDEGKITFTVDT